MHYFGLILLALYASLGDAAEPRIINGVNVTAEEYPYQLYFRANNGVCGASIISENWALTAGHCLERFEYGYIHAGSSNRSEAKGSVHSIIQAVKHPNWNSVLLDYDYGLLKVYPPFNLTDSRLSAVKLAEADPPTGLPVNLAGWGLTSFGGNISNTLLGADFTIMSRETCGMYFNPITKRMICASNLVKSQTGCSGDSGGPLVNKQTGIQYGITSFVAYGCPTRGLPNAFASVANQREWIRNITGI